MKKGWQMTGMGKANVDPETGIRHGVISQHSVLEEALDDFSFVYGKPRCPKCGEEVSADDVGQYDFLCNRCNCGFRAEDVYPDEPLGSHYDQEGYLLTNRPGGDILVLRSDFYTLAQFRNPRVPGAGNLDAPMEDGVKTYALGHDWFEGGVAPYPVYRVSDDAQIIAVKVETVCDHRRGTGKDTSQRSTEV